MIPTVVLIVLLFISIAASALSFNNWRVFSLENAGLKVFFTLFIFYYSLIFGILTLATLKLPEFFPGWVSYVWVRGIFSAVITVIIALHSLLGIMFVRHSDDKGFWLPLGCVDSSIEATFSYIQKAHGYTAKGVCVPVAVYISFLSNPEQSAVAIRAYSSIFAETSEKDSDVYHILINTEIKDQKASLIIARALKSLDTERRSDAIYLLEQWESHHPEVFDSLFNAASSDPDQGIRLQAVRALANLNIRDPRLEAFALEKINTADPIGAAFLFSLSESDPRIPQAFIRYLNDTNPKVRKAWWEAAFWGQYDYRLLAGCGDEALISRIMKHPVHGAALRSIFEKRPIPKVRRTLSGPSVFIEIK